MDWHMHYTVFDLYFHAHLLVDFSKSTCLCQDCHSLHSPGLGVESWPGLHLIPWEQWLEDARTNQSFPDTPILKEKNISLACIFQLDCISKHQAVIDQLKFHTAGENVWDQGWETTNSGPLCHHLIFLFWFFLKPLHPVLETPRYVKYWIAIFKIGLLVPEKWITIPNNSLIA